MKKINLLFTVMLFCYMSTYSQTAADSITISKIRGGYQFMQYGRLLTVSQLGETLRSNDAAYKEFKKGRGTYSLSMVMAGTGGFLIGWPLGTAIGGGDPNWAMAGVGAGLVAIALPLSMSSAKRIKSAAEIYNLDIQHTYFPGKRLEFNFGLHSNGIGLLVNF